MYQISAGKIFHRWRPFHNLPIIGTHASDQGRFGSRNWGENWGFLLPFGCGKRFGPQNPVTIFGELWRQRTLLSVLNEIQMPLILLRLAFLIGEEIQYSGLIGHGAAR